MSEKNVPALLLGPVSGPCKCGETFIWLYEAFPGKWKVECSECRNSTGLCKSRNESIWKWNKLNRRAARSGKGEA